MLFKILLIIHLTFQTNFYQNIYKIKKAVNTVIFYITDEQYRKFWNVYFGAKIK